MLTMKQVISQIEQVCESCPSRYCAGCKIKIKLDGENITVNGFTRKIEKVEKTPAFA